VEFRNHSLVESAKKIFHEEKCPVINKSSQAFKVKQIVWDHGIPDECLRHFPIRPLV
jgi:hypothetical protein